MRPSHLIRLFHCVLLLGAGLLGPAAGAQPLPLPFGSADDPQEELQNVWWRRQNTLNVMAGLSLIGPQWRAVTAARLDLATRSFDVRLQGTLRAGIYGEYEPDVDEWYDLVRLVDFVRYNPPRQTPLYLRAGALERIRLGTGHTVNFLNSNAAVEERTVGVETMLSYPGFDLAAFTDNVLVDGVVGGHLAVRPFYLARSPLTRSLTFGFSYATDLATHRPALREVTAYNVEVSVNALRSGAISFIPFASFAWYDDHGRGLSFGADLESLNFIDLARFRIRLALFYNGKRFIPGYLGSFYTVSNPTARILNSDEYLSGQNTERLEGVTLADALGGNDLLTELRLLLFERFELWYYFRRHYGTQALSEYHVRLYVRLIERLRLNLGVDRGGLRGIFSLFNEMGDQTLLVFNMDYRIAGPLWVYIRARYGFDRVDDGPDAQQRYLPERRFEPMSGLRLTL